MKASAKNIIVLIAILLILGFFTITIWTPLGRNPDVINSAGVLAFILGLLLVYAFLNDRIQEIFNKKRK